MTDDDNRSGEGGAGRRVLLGHITGAHGIRGAVLVRSYTAEPGAIADYGILEDEAGLATFTLSVEGATAKGVICRVAGVDDRNGAERLKGVALYVPRDRLPPPDDGEYYHTDLVGLAAVTEAGAALGEVVAVLNYGAGDILEVRPDGAKRTDLYPMTEAVVVRVDIAGGVIVIAPPEEVDAGDANGGDAV
ncbi:ribosome maturation factor RimM [Hyphomicrobium sp.]|uniref:ribosome maturation factor RimM n=1 Tax=Hyphomicrobium sp. TaxID=82 RepID=UPI002B52749A|nr:ribosome maturation factor RimM [Hyphomicrobium sp.]HRN88966.1 ribosome maturation factor RimM [Hyphomicrobium sp.]HRQ26471.1 ribosome maturation factor RimM [Hyphomicrobium sp.]